MNHPKHNQSFKHFPVVVVGGGIVGAGIFRDLCLQNIPTLILDKYDFGSQTSEKSSKMLHGGIRYLENFDFPLIKEALHEKNLWLKIAPQFCVERPFVIPTYHQKTRPLWQLKVGLFLYDLLSGFQNTPHQIWNKEKLLSQISSINQDNLTGAGVYWDAIMDDNLFTIHSIKDGLRTLNSEAWNYHELIEYQNDEEVLTLKIYDHHQKKTKIITTDYVIFSLGPFTDQFFNKTQNPSKHNYQNMILPSKGSHLWIKKDRLPIHSSMVMVSKNPDGSERVIFVIPHPDAILIGTTEVKIDPNFQNHFYGEELNPSNEEISYLLKNLNQYFPHANITDQDIITSFAGVRPLVYEGNENLSKTSREHKVKILSTREFIICGGKYTTFRSMGMELSRTICLNLKRPYSPQLSERPFQSAIYVTPFLNTFHDDIPLEKILEEEFVKSFEDLVKRRMAIKHRSLWRGSMSFEDYFLKHLKLMNQYFPCEKEEILTYSK